VNILKNPSEKPSATSLIVNRPMRGLRPGYWRTLDLYGLKVSLVGHTRVINVFDVSPIIRQSVPGNALCKLMGLTDPCSRTS